MSRSPSGGSTGRFKTGQWHRFAAGIEAELALRDSLEGYVEAMRNERAFTLSTFREYPMWGYWILRGFGNDLQLRAIDLYDQVIAGASSPYLEITSGIHRTVRHGGLNPYALLVTGLEPALFPVRVAAERTRAMALVASSERTFRLTSRQAATRFRISTGLACLRRRPSTLTTASHCTSRSCPKAGLSIP